MEKIQKRFGERIQSIRTEQNITQQELADRMGVDRSYISKIENGKKNPSLKRISRLSELLDTPLATIFQFE